MKPVKKYFSGWDVTRIVRLALSVALGIGFYSTKEPAYLVLSALLGIQAAFNFSCAGGSCASSPAKNEKPVTKFKEYKPEK